MYGGFLTNGIREGRTATKSMVARGSTIREIIASRVDELKACTIWGFELTARQIRWRVIAEMREDRRWMKRRPVAASA